MQLELCNKNLIQSTQSLRAAERKAVHYQELVENRNHIFRHEEQSIEEQSIEEQPIHGNMDKALLSLNESLQAKIDSQAKKLLERDDVVKMITSLYEEMCSKIKGSEITRKIWQDDMNARNILLKDECNRLFKELNESRFENNVLRGQLEEKDNIIDNLEDICQLWNEKGKGDDSIKRALSQLFENDRNSLLIETDKKLENLKNLSEDLMSNLRVQELQLKNSENENSKLMSFLGILELKFIESQDTIAELHQELVSLQENYGKIRIQKAQFSPTFYQIADEHTHSINDVEEAFNETSKDQLKNSRTADIVQEIDSAFSIIQGLKTDIEYLEELQRGETLNDSYSSDYFSNVDTSKDTNYLTNNLMFFKDFIQQEIRESNRLYSSTSRETKDEIVCLCETSVDIILAQKTHIRDLEIRLQHFGQIVIQRESTIDEIQEQVNNLKGVIGNIATQESSSLQMEDLFAEMKVLEEQNERYAKENQDLMEQLEFQSAEILAQLNEEKLLRAESEKKIHNLEKSIEEKSAKLNGLQYELKGNTEFLDNAFKSSKLMELSRAVEIYSDCEKLKNDIFVLEEKIRLKEIECSEISLERENDLNEYESRLSSIKDIAFELKERFCIQDSVLPEPEDGTLNYIHKILVHIKSADINTPLQGLRNRGVSQTVELFAEPEFVKILAEKEDAHHFELSEVLLEMEILKQRNISLQKQVQDLG